MDIIDKINLFSIDEGWEKVIRKGKIKRKLICPVGMKAKNGKCVMMKPTEKRNLFKAALLRGKKMKANVNVMIKAKKKRAKSMKKREIQIGD